MQVNDKIKPCPFCGGNAEIFHDYGLSSVICLDCHTCSFWADDDEDAIELWNTRAERTCSNVAVQGVFFECSECGAKTVDAVGNYTQKYCAACGRRVQDAD